jgi:hypothetical protein
MRVHEMTDWTCKIKKVLDLPDKDPSKLLRLEELSAELLDAHIELLKAGKLVADKLKNMRKN